MSKRLKPGPLILLLIFTWAGSVIASSAPNVIPALQHWTPGPDSFALTPDSRLIFDPASMDDLAVQLIADIDSAIGIELAPVDGGCSKLKAGDICLGWSLEKIAMPDDAYRLHIGQAVRIESWSGAGLFYGTQSLLQLLQQSMILPGGQALDYPVYPERALMLDVARKFYSLDFLRARIREMAYLKLNVLHLHLSDDQGFRLESDSHPAVVSAQHYTKAEMADLIEYAHEFGVRIVPEIDMPGHMTWILQHYPALGLEKTDGTLSLDLAQPAAWALAEDLLLEYLSLFPDPHWSLGADEWMFWDDLQNYPHLAAHAQSLYGPNATARDLLHAFVNWADQIIGAHGKITRIWNDQIVSDPVVEIDSGIVIDHWWGETDPGPQDFLDNGHRLNNVNGQMLYGITDTFYYPDPATLYENFQVNRFSIEPWDGVGQEVLADDPGLLGGKLAIWSEGDNGLTEAHVAGRLAPVLRPVAQKLWGSPLPAPDYSGFRPLADAVGGPPPRRPRAASSMGTFWHHAPSDMIDGDLSTHYWSNQGPQIGDWIMVDLGHVQPVASIELLMATTGYSGDFIHQGVLEYSIDGQAWSSISSHLQEPEITVAVALSARYVRFRSTATQASWVIVRAFYVQ